jgi:membrane protein YdbS with pleckstrin-like domain
MPPIFALDPAAYPVRVTVFSAWPPDVQWRPLSRRLLWLELSGHVVRLLISIALFAVAFAFWAGGGSWWLVALILLGIFIIGTLIRIVTLPRNIRSWGYAERADDLLVRHGLLVRRLSIVPYGRMQFVDVTAGPLERALGLATVQLHTAAAASDARIPGLLPDEATRLRDRLTALGQARAEGL